MHSKYSIIVSNGWENHLILYISPFHIQWEAATAAILSLIEWHSVIKMYNHRFCEWNDSLLSQNGRYEALTHSILDPASLQVRMCHFKSITCFHSELEYEHRLTLIWWRKQKYTDKPADMKLMGSLLSNCTNHIIFNCVNTIFGDIYNYTAHLWKGQTSCCCFVYLIFISVMSFYR